MNGQYRTVWAALVVAAVGAAGVAGRLAYLRNRPPSPGERAYRLRYEVAFKADKAGVRVRAALPDNTPRCRIYQATYSHPQLGFEIVPLEGTGQREAVATALGPAERATFSAEFDVYLGKAFGPSPTPAQEPLSEDERSQFLRAEPNVQVRSDEVAAAVAGLTAEPATGEKLLGRIFEYACARIAEAGELGPSDAAGAIRGKRASPVGRARAMVALCRAGQIPAQVVTGFVLEESQAANPHSWVEAWSSKGWEAYDPAAGYARSLPANYLPARRGGGPVVQALETADHETRFSVRPLRAGQAAPAVWGGGWDILHFSRLPTGMQETLAVLLLLPVGALITALLRNVVGVQTFGTFAPSLLALSFLYADWRTGLMIFLLVAGIGLGGRALLSYLRLLMVPRLSVILSLVVMCTAFAISAFDYFGMSPSPRAVILPMVILTMLIERFYITAEEDGMRSALRLLTGTLLVGGICLLVLRWRELGSLALNYPEMDFFAVAALLLVGRYSGYRLSELVRFRDFAKTAPPGL